MERRFRNECGCSFNKFLAARLQRTRLLHTRFGVLRRALSGRHSSGILMRPAFPAIGLLRQRDCSAAMQERLLEKLHRKNSYSNKKVFLFFMGRSISTPMAGLLTTRSPLVLSEIPTQYHNGRRVMHNSDSETPSVRRPAKSCHQLHRAGSVQRIPYRPLAVLVFKVPLLTEHLRLLFRVAGVP